MPTDEDAVFRFNGSMDSAKTYTFQVRQTYSNGKVVDWSGSESSDTPAPTIEASLRLGGGSSSTLTIVALVVGAVGVVLGDRRAGDERAALDVRRAALLAAVAVAALALPAAAWAHAALLRTVPEASRTVNRHRRRCGCTYSEPIEPRFAIVSVTDAAGRQVTSGAAGRALPGRRRRS